ncbi:hypothetical protein SUGI_0030280 [Cryptomeria japonica]|nr:hypothetical protein SUGI_0030280 [Cryptomeria japonica]
MEWKVLDDKIKKWIHAAKISIPILFAREKQLCVDVFVEHDKMRDPCFAEIAKERTERLLAIAEAVAAASRAPERMFRVLDLYEALTDLMPEIERHVFSRSLPKRTLAGQQDPGETRRGGPGNFDGI